MISDFTGGNTETRTKLNELVAVARKVENISGGGEVHVRHTANGININVERRRGGSGGTSGDLLTFVWGTVISGLAYIDPASGDFDGQAYYNVRVADVSSIDVWTTYDTWVAGQQCLYPDSDGTLYEARATIGAHFPIPPNNPLWLAVNEVVVDSAWGFLNTSDFDLRDCVPWFQDGEEILLIYKDNEYYIAGALVYCGAAVSTSLRWQDTGNSGRTVAVFS